MDPHPHFYFFPSLSADSLIYNKWSTNKCGLNGRVDAMPCRGPCPIFVLLYACFIVDFPWLVIFLLCSSSLYSSPLSKALSLLCSPFPFVIFLWNTTSYFLWPLVYFAFSPTLFLSSISFSLSNWSKNKPPEGYLHSVLGTIPVAQCWT